MTNIKRNIIFTGLGYALPLLAALVTIPVMLKYLGQDLYGLYIICVSLIGFMNQVDFGIGQTIVKYVSEYEVTEQHHKIKPVLDISLLIYVSVALLTAGSLLIFSQELAALFYEDGSKQQIASDVLRITAIGLFLGYVNQFFLNVCRAYHRFDISATIHNSGNLGGIIVSSVLLILGHSIYEVMWSYVIIYAIAIINGYYFSSGILPRNIHYGFAFDKAIFERIVSFSFYTFIANFIAALTTRADKLFIGAIIGTEGVTLYQIPYAIAQMANGIIYTLVQILFPRFSELSSLNEKSKLLTLYKNVTVIMAVIVMCITILLFTVGGDFLAIWISPQFAEQTTFTLQIIAIYFFFHSNTLVAYWLVQGLGNAKLTATIAIIGAVIYFTGLAYLSTHYSYNGANGANGAAFALFLLLIVSPFPFLWIARVIGHPYIDYLFILLATFLLGVMITVVLDALNKMIANSFMEILADGLAIGMLLALFLLFFFRNEPSFSKNRLRG